MGMLADQVAALELQRDGYEEALALLQRLDDHVALSLDALHGIGGDIAERAFLLDSQPPEHARHDCTAVERSVREIESRLAPAVLVPLIDAACLLTSLREGILPEVPAFPATAPQEPTRARPLPRTLQQALTAVVIDIWPQLVNAVESGDREAAVTRLFEALTAAAQARHLCVPAPDPLTLR